MVAGGVSAKVDQAEIAAWVKDAEIEVARAGTRLLMSVDAHEDDFGYRFDSTADFPRDWSSRQERDFEAMTGYLSTDQFASARRQWRLLEMERDTLALFTERLGHLDTVRVMYLNQFNLGQRPLTAVIGVSRNYYDIEVQKIDAEFRLYDAQAQLLAMIGRLFEGDLRQPREVEP